MKKRIYRNKNYWFKEALRESEKLPSEKLKELIKDEKWKTIRLEILSLKNIIKDFNL